MRKKRTKNDQLRDDSSWLLEKEEESSREFKVRIVERLTFLERRLNCNGTTVTEEGGVINENESNEEGGAPCLQSELIQNEDVLETMGREYIKRLMLNLFERLKVKYQGTEELK